MEISILFLVMIATIGACHLTHRVTKRMRKQNLTDELNKKCKEKNDWFCFFSLPRLYGSKSESDTINTVPMEESEKINKRRRAQANRPRIRA